EGVPEEPNNGEGGTNVVGSAVRGGVASNGASKGVAGSGNRPKNHPVPLKHLRIYCTDSELGSYRVIGQAEKNVLCSLEIQIVGEVGYEMAPIDFFKIDAGEKQLPKT